MPLGNGSRRSVTAVSTRPFAVAGAVHAFAGDVAIAEIVDVGWDGAHAHARGSVGRRVGRRLVLCGKEA